MVCDFVGARIPTTESPSSLNLKFESQNLPGGSPSLLFIDGLMRPLRSVRPLEEFIR